MRREWEKLWELLCNLASFCRYRFSARHRLWDFFSARLVLFSFLLQCCRMSFPAVFPSFHHPHPQTYSHQGRDRFTNYHVVWLSPAPWGLFPSCVSFSFHGMFRRICAGKFAAKTFAKMHWPWVQYSTNIAKLEEEYRRANGKPGKYKKNNPRLQIKRKIDFLVLAGYYPTVPSYHTQQQSVLHSAESSSTVAD